MWNEWLTKKKKKSKINLWKIKTKTKNCVVFRWIYAIELVDSVNCYFRTINRTKKRCIRTQTLDCEIVPTNIFEQTKEWQTKNKQNEKLWIVVTVSAVWLVHSEDSISKFNQFKRAREKNSVKNFIKHDFAEAANENERTRNIGKNFHMKIDEIINLWKSTTCQTPNQFEHITCSERYVNSRRREFGEKLMN